MALRWDTDGRDWPNRSASRFVRAGTLEWHVQEMGEGPCILLLHGTGSATHSWRDLMPILAKRYRVIALDLPGHGFTQGKLSGGLSLHGISRALDALVRALAIEPALVVGHSAGSAIAIQWAQDSDCAAPIIGLNPALTPFPGLAAQIFPAMAKMLFVNPFAPRLFAQIARVPGETERFLERSTGSSIDGAGLQCYRQLFGTSRHCAGALDMMASWNLDALHRSLAKVVNPVMLVHAANDQAIQQDSVEQALAQLPNATMEVVPKLGHLAHEENPEQIAELIEQFARENALTPAR